MGYKENYESWLNNPYFDEDTRNELKSIEGNEKEIEDRFYMDLEFGTAGTSWCDRSRNQPHEHLYRAQGYTGTCQLYQQGKRTETRCCHCL